MGWLRLVGFLKEEVSFAEYRLFYRALLSSGNILLSRYGVATISRLLKIIGLFCRISSLL